MPPRSTKHSYTIPCPSPFRDDIEALAANKGINVADLLRSVVLVLNADAIRAFPDPGDPRPGDRETVILKSGKAKGRPWRRKPRLQVRMTVGYEITFLRRALAAALAIDRGEAVVHVEAPSHGLIVAPGAGAPLPADVRDEMDRLRAIVAALSFEPLAGGIQTRDQALHILGYPPGAIPDQASIRARFRTLATIHHPDSGYGSHDRMSQLNSAMEFLRV